MRQKKNSVEVCERLAGVDHVHAGRCLLKIRSTWSSVAKRPSRAALRPRSIPASSAGVARYLPVMRPASISSGDGGLCEPAVLARVLVSPRGKTMFEDATAFRKTRRRGGKRFHASLCKSGPGCSRAKTLAVLMVGPCCKPSTIPR